MNFIKNITDRINNSTFSYASKKDKRQVLTLAIGISAIILGSEMQNYVFANDSEKISPQEQMQFKMRLDSLTQKYTESRQVDTLNRLDAYIVKRYSELQLFDFNPNTVTEEELLKLGFTEKQAGNLLRYRENGGRFSCADDFRKLYGLRTMQYKLLKEHLVFSQSDMATNKARSVKDSIFKAREKELFYFDPNTIDEEQMYKLGWSTKQIESFLKMRNEGKKFYVKKDLSTIFFIDNDKYKELEPYIRIDESKLFEGKKKYDLNLATADELEAAGFSTSEASKVIKFREDAGYFYSTWQLSDCGIEYNKAKKLGQNVYTCMSVTTKKIKINEVTADELARHPYFSAKQAAAVIRFRNEKGKIRHISDFQSMNAFDDKEIKKIKNYVEF